MQDLKITEADYVGNDISSLDENYYEGQADFLKQRFDAAAKNVIAPKFNQLIDELAAEGAAQYIGAMALNSNSGETVQAIIEYLWEQMQNITFGAVPDDSVTTEKIAVSAVTGEKIADSAVTEGKIAEQSVTTGKIAEGAVTKSLLADGAVSEEKLNEALKKMLASFVTSGDFQEALLTKVNKTDVIALKYGGTGATSARAAEYNISNGIEELVSDMNDDSRYICQRTTSANTANGAFGYRTGGNLWTWIASKIRSVFGFSSSNVLPVANGGTGSTSKLAALRNLGVLESTFSPGGTACFYVGDIEDQPWYTDTTMKTYAFINGMPAKSVGIFAGNGKKLDDQPNSYCQMLVVKGTNMNYANAIAWRISTAASPQFYTYSASASSGAGTWGEK